jgi:hypothetical protein
MKSAILLIAVAFSLSLISTSCVKTKFETKTDTLRLRDTLTLRDTLLIAAKDTTFAMNADLWGCFGTSFNPAGELLSAGSSIYFTTSEGIKVLSPTYRKFSRLQTKNVIGFKDKTIYYKWKVNGFGSFAAFVLQVKYDPLTIDGKPQIQGVDFGLFTVGNTFDGSKLVNNDVWYYSRIKPVAGSDNYQVITATTNYDNKGGTVISSTEVPVYTKWGYIALRLTDNYNTNAYMVLGECKIASN